jgi:hypothetical protein
MFRRLFTIAVVTLFLLSSFLVVANTVSATTQPVTKSGTTINVGGNPTFLDGVNDQTVIPYQFYPYPAYNYRYSNHLFPSYTGDTTTKITASNYTDFWYKYFSAVKSLGLNSVRLGGFDGWALSWMHSTWNNNYTLWMSVIDPMLSMADYTGVYIIFCFGGGRSDETFSSTDYSFGDSVSHPMAGNLFTIGSACYNEYVAFIGQVMTQYSGQSCIAMWDLFNEPEGDLLYLDYWHTLATPKASYKAWATSLITDAKAIDHNHLLTIGAQGYGNFFGWGESEFDGEQDIGADVSHLHYYSGTNTNLGNYWITDRYSWSYNLGIPIYVGEYGWGSGGINYYDWCHDAMVTYGYGGCAALALWGYPGYPKTAGQLAAFVIPVDYWAITPPDTPVVVPSGDPSPADDPHVIVENLPNVLPQTTNTVDYTWFMPWMLALSPVIQSITGTADTPQVFYNKLIAEGAIPENGVAYVIANNYADWNYTSWYSLEYMWPFIQMAYPLAGLLSWDDQEYAFIHNFSPPIVPNNFYSELIVNVAFGSGFIDAAQLTAIQQGLHNLDTAIQQFLNPILSPPITPATFIPSIGLISLVLLIGITFGFSFFFYSMRRR